jgi:hypothetical protein
MIEKIANPLDADDKTWATEWLARIEAEIEKKERGKDQKTRDSRTGRFTKRKVAP